MSKDEQGINLEAVRREFLAKQSLYVRLRDEALFIIEPAIANAAIKIHSVTSRVKSVDSFMGKAQRKQSAKPFEEIRDVVGVRVICLFLSDIERIGRLVRESFNILEEDNKVEGAEISSFGYMSVHFIAEMKREHVGPRYDPIAGIPLEIQVRTIAMDAWANVSHYLDYKTDKDVPSDLRRDFYALSGLFYVADRHFEMFFLSRKESQERLMELFQEPASAEQFKQELNFDSLVAYLVSKYPDRERGRAVHYSELVEQLLKAGYKTIDDIDKGLNRGSDAFLKYEADTPKDTSRSLYFADVGAARLTLCLTDDKVIQAGINAYPIHKTFYENLRIESNKYRELIKE